MKICLIIPSYNHNESLKMLMDSISVDIDIIVVDDGSIPKIELAKHPRLLLRLDKNSGKANAMKIAFDNAESLGYTHAITMDSDGQHSPASLPQFIELANKNPNAIISGTRDFTLPEIPKGRRFLNKFSNFWYWYETGKVLEDTQCGYRCYPLGELKKLNIEYKGFVFETELLVKATWAEIEIIELKIPTIYTKESLVKSHYKPFSDTLKFTLMNTRLSFMSTFFTKNFRKKLVLK